MMLREWRLTKTRSQADCATALGLEGGARSYQRIEVGENNTDADMVERIAILTDGAVSAEDMHRVRLAWLRANRPEKFAQLPSSAPEPVRAGAGLSACAGVPAE
jgi:transcriptional regulator with XRE-family HTH domain